MKKEKLPISRWLLDICGLFCLLLLVYFIDSCSKQLLSSETLLCSTPWDILIVAFLFLSFAGIAMRNLIFHPKQNKKWWMAFGIIGLCTLFYNLYWGAINNFMELLGIIILTFFFSSIFIFFLWNRDSVKNKTDKKYIVPKHDVIFYITLSSIACAFCVLRYGIFGRGWDPLLLMFVLPVYMFFLSVWVYRGWENRRFCQSLILLITMLMLLPLVLVFPVVGNILAIFLLAFLCSKFLK